jgi:hypothetical protein
MKLFSPVILMFTLAMTMPALATVVVSSPSNGQTVASNVQFVASANTTTCSGGVAAMGIYVDYSLYYHVNGVSLNTTLSLSSGSHNVVVVEWDFCGGATSTPISLTVSNNNQTGVFVTSPTNGSAVGSSTTYTASAATSCPMGVAAMGIYVNHELAYVTPGATLNTQLTLSAGSQNTVVQEWDYCGGSSTAAVQVAVSGTTLSNLQAAGGWNQWGELPPVYDICSAPCGGVTWSMNQHISANSLSGDATQFNLGGTTPYSDVLWSNPLIGDGTTQNLPDTNHTLLPSVHHLILDTNVFVTNLAVTQDLEFDVNMFMNGVGMEWGTECNHLATGTWDIWNNVNAQWVSTSAPCSLNDNAWNHVTIQVQRETNNDLTYQTITVNGVVYNINQTVAPFSVPSGWWGMTVNYQMDGNYKQAANTTYLDKTSVTYW